MTKQEKIEMTLDYIVDEFGADRKEVEDQCYIEVKGNEVHVSEGMGGSTHVYEFLTNKDGIDYVQWSKEIM